MDLGYLLEKQRQLDNYILKTKCLEGFDRKSRLNSTALAMFVEMGEMMNEIRSFKFWSDKPSSHRTVIIEEYVDVLHFFLSLANQLGIIAEDIEMAYEKKNKVNFERQNTGY